MTTTPNTDRVKLTPEELAAMMTPGEYVHTLIQAIGPGTVLLGADWKRSELLDIARTHGAELSGEAATKMKHGAVVFDRKQAVFVSTGLN